MKTHRIQAAFARKREAENLRIERSTANNRYFDHWGKVTSRFESWTTPQYYENAEETLRKSKEKEIKEKKLNERRQKLEILLNNEKFLYENELTAQILKKPSQLNNKLNGRRFSGGGSRLDGIATNVLEKIDRNLKETNDERRRIELEAKLYSRWRRQPIGKGPDCTNDCLNRCTSSCGRCTPLDDNALFESKTDNQIFAKLNWLDKQIEDQMRREQEAKESELRTLQLQKETRKHEETLKERQKIRESEIKELRAIQENHVHELKQREHESNLLQTDEIQFKNILDLLEAELLMLNNRGEKFNNQIDSVHNINKIKMIFRQRSQYYFNELKNDIDRLKTLLIAYTNNNNNVSDLEILLNKYEKQLNDENTNQLEIDNMYESEAKHNLKKWEQLWFNEYYIRQNELIAFIEKLKEITIKQINDNVKQQKQLIDVRETHLSSIENSNEKLKMLINEQEQNSITLAMPETTTTPSVVESLNQFNSNNIKIESGRNSRTYRRSFGFNWIDDNDNNNGVGDNNNSTNKNYIDFTTKKFNNLNMSGNKNTTNENGGGGGSDQPKFGRKKVAWT